MDIASVVCVDGLEVGVGEREVGGSFGILVGVIGRIELLLRRWGRLGAVRVFFEGYLEFSIVGRSLRCL